MVFEVGLDRRIFEDAAVSPKDDAAQQLQIFER